MEGKFSICVLDGCWCDPDDEYESFLSYHGLSWEETLKLMQQSLDEGYEVIVDREDG